MKKLSLFMLCALIAFTGFAIKRDFTAVCLNVDGLPPEISIIGIKVKLNSDGPQEAGSEAISKKLAEKQWDFVALSEDFNYHSQLMSHISGLYDAGEWRGEASLSNSGMSGGKLKLKTDGLGFLWKKNYSVSGYEAVQWNKTNGYTDQGADELLLKGYRYYCIKLGNGLECDLYMIHMDAETGEKDNAARQSQIEQLVAKIKASDNKRPIIVLGDTNCRYTRDDLKAKLIDAINADPRFEMHDPWIDFAREGVYPNQGDDAIMVDQEGHYKGEVVDKVFYINNTEASAKLTAHSYLRDASFVNESGQPLADHFPIVVEFTIEDPNVSLAAGEYYLRNAANGKYLNAGGWWGTHAMLDTYGNRINLENAGNNQYYLKSTFGYFDRDDVYIDKDNSIKHTWDVTPVDGTDYVTITHSDGTRALGANLSDNYVNVIARDDNDRTQMWELVSEEALINELGNASPENPKDATFLFRSAKPHNNDSDKSAWVRSGTGRNAKYEIGGDGNPDFMGVYHSYNDKVVTGTTTEFTITNTISNLPNGKYIISGNVLNKAGDTTFSINDRNIDIASSNGDCTIANVVPQFKAGGGAFTHEVEVTNHSIVVKFHKKSNKSATSLCFGNFRLMYLGNQALYDRVKKAIDTAAQIAEENGFDEYDNSYVVNRWENREIDVNSNGNYEIRLTAEALAHGAIASKNAPEPVNLTYGILDNSFEFGEKGIYKSGDWNYDVNFHATEVGVKTVKDAPYTTAGADGNWQFNAWGDGRGTPISQTLKGLPGGIYTLRVKVASDPGNSVFIFANSFNKGMTIEGENNAMFHELELEFELQEGEDLVIGANGGDGGNFTMGNGCWYKVDDFRLTREKSLSTINLTFPGEYDTLVLPFDSELPEGLFIYTVTGYDSDIKDHDFYGKHVVIDVQQENHIKAHTPYLVYETEQAVSRAANNNNRTYTFKGTYNNDIPADGLKNGVLTGTYAPFEPEDGHYVVWDHDSYNGHNLTVFTNNAENKKTVEPYRAFINAPELAVQGVENVRLHEEDTPTGVEAVEANGEFDPSAAVNVYNVNGMLILRAADFSEAKSALVSGIYLLRQGTLTLKLAL